MKYLRTNPVGLRRALEPIGYFLDGCWYEFGGHGFRDEPVRSYLGPKTIDEARSTADDPARMAAHITEAEATKREQEEWLDSSRGNRIGRPGFFSRYTPDFQWSVHFASDMQDCPYDDFSRVRALYETDWFSFTISLPPSICMMARDIDNSYHEFFFRDEWAFALVEAHAKEAGFRQEPVPIEEMKKRAQRAKRRRR